MSVALRDLGKWSSYVRLVLPARTCRVTKSPCAEPSIARKLETPPAEPEAEQAVTELFQPEVEAIEPATEADADVQEEVDPQGLDKRQD